MAEDSEDRQEYYKDTIEDIVEEQKDFLGEELALKQARQAPLSIDSEGNVEDFYGKGEDALEILRSYTEHQEFYLETIQRIVDNISNFFGQEMSLGYARKSPLEVTPEGEVKAYYGKGRKALNILVENLEQDIGKEAADKRIKRELDDLSDDEKKLLPENIRPQPSGEKKGLIDRVTNIFA
ncbi:MAG: hypothetical protein ABEJ95_04790 [Candidatus Nanohalobium sp.]